MVYQQRCSLFSCIGEIITDVNKGFDGVTDAIVAATGDVIDGTAHGIEAAANGTGSGLGDVLEGTGDLLGGAAVVLDMFLEDWRVELEQQLEEEDLLLEMQKKNLARL